MAITEYRKFFVSGEVKSPGGFSFEPGLTLEKAIALSGGFTGKGVAKKDQSHPEKKMAGKPNE